MRVKVKFFTLFRLEYGLKEILIEIEKDSITIDELLSIIDKKTGKKIKEKLFLNEDKIKTSAIILVNGENIFHLDGLKTLIYDNDVISLFPPGGGG